MTEAWSNPDWVQVVLNHGPPCFHVEEGGRFCFRAERWHDDIATEMFHKFVSLEAFVEQIKSTTEAKYAPLLKALEPFEPGVDFVPWGKIKALIPVPIAKDLTKKQVALSAAIDQIRKPK